MPPALWPQVLAEHSLRRPAALRAPLSQPLLTPAELFALLVAAAESIRRGTPRELRLYLGDRKMVWRQTVDQLGAAYPGLLPQRADATLAGYGERLRRRGYPCFAIMLNNCQVLSPTVWRRVREFAAGLSAELGFPLGGFDANLFAGNYRRTPFGVHTDELDVFTWIVEGAKRFRVWPAEQLDPLFGASAAAPRHPHDYADLRARGQRLEGRAGDLLYWPKEYWHVAEAGADQLSSTLSIGRDPQLPIQAWARELMAKVAGELGAQLAAPTELALAAASAELPAALGGLAVAAGQPSLPQRFERELRLRWMCWATSLGLRTPARARPKPLRVKDRLRGDPDWPIYSLVWKRSLFCAANGYAIAIPASKRIEKILMRLNSGAIVLVGDLYLSLSRDAERQWLQVLLHSLLAFRAISVVETRPRSRPAGAGTRKALTGSEKK